MRAKWLDINNGLRDKDTCTIRRAAFEHTHTHTLFFYKNGKFSILECDKEKAGPYVIFYVNQTNKHTLYTIGDIHIIRITLRHIRVTIVAEEKK
jgi:hypothetical protein